MFILDRLIQKVVLSFVKLGQCCKKGIVNSVSNLKLKIKARVLIKLFITAYEKCPHTEYFLVLIFLYSDRVRRFTESISVFSPNTGKCGPENTPYVHTSCVVHRVAVTEIARDI